MKKYDSIKTVLLEEKVTVTLSASVHERCVGLMRQLNHSLPVGCSPAVSRMTLAAMASGPLALSTFGGGRHLGFR